VFFRRSTVLQALHSLALCAFVSSPTVFASPVPPDNISLLNGAAYFERYCTECHGWNPDDQYTDLYDKGPADDDDPLLGLMSLTEEEDAKDLEQLLEDSKYDDWPVWADPPPKKTQSEEDELEAAILADLLSAIDEIYDEETEPYGWDVAEDNYVDEDEQEDSIADPFGEDLNSELDRMPGATDLLDPESFTYGTTEVELFNSIAEGTGPMMPGFMELLGEEEAVWDLINYIRSLWGEDWVD
jgi:mono/diheme cytochrome c family protein